MEFDRVRTPEQRKIRIDQIKDAAITLFDRMQYHEITLALIANETNFTRGNLYKYITSKEDIFLLVFLDEIKAWNNELDNAIKNDMSNDIATFAKQWANIANQHPRFLKLMALLYTILERNVTLEKLIDFKDNWYVEVVRSLNIIRRAFPQWSNETVRRFLQLQKNYVIGLFPTVSPSEIQLQAIEKSTMVYIKPDFISDFSEFIEYTVKYLNTKK